MVKAHDYVNEFSDKSPLRWILVACVCICIAVLTPRYLKHKVDQLWIEEAHQSLLRALVEARTHAWDERVGVQVCLADANQQCLSEPKTGYEVPVNSTNKPAGWLTFVTINGKTDDGKTDDGKTDGGEARSIQLSETVGFHPFAWNKVFIRQGQDNMPLAALGFNAAGYSIHSEVVSLDVFSRQGVSNKSYKIIIEPSGALQTLASTQKHPSFDRARSLVDIQRVAANTAYTATEESKARVNPVNL